MTVGQDESSVSTSQIVDQDDNDQTEGSSLTPGLVHPNLAEKTKKKNKHEVDQLIKSFGILSSSAAAPTIEENDSKSFAIYIGEKLQKYSEKTRNATQHAICDIIFRADEGIFELS